MPAALPESAAVSSALQPTTSCALGLPPASVSCCMMSIDGFSAAAINAVAQCSSRALASAPCFNNRLTSRASPASTASKSNSVSCCWADLVLSDAALCLASSQTKLVDEVAAAEEELEASVGFGLVCFAAEDF